MKNRAEVLRDRINTAENELECLKQELFDLDSKPDPTVADGFPIDDRSMADAYHDRPLLLEEYARYGRQMIVSNVGLEGQLKLKKASILIVGLGGLGCPAAAYLAAAGVGTIGLIDDDKVELSNLHRQILHNANTVGMSKVDSALLYLRQLNSMVNYVSYRQRLSPPAAREIFSRYDIILDCTDNPSSRYLISDAAVLLGKRLVSASALGSEGQLMVLNDPPLPAGDVHGGPCYRCIFPKPPAAASVTTCDEGGILGPVVGLMGVHQALEALKLAFAGINVSGTGSDVQAATIQSAPKPARLMIFSAFNDQPFRSVRLRPRRPRCAVCSATASITLDTLYSGSTDYQELCGVGSPVAVLDDEERVSVHEYDALRKAGVQHVLYDVREKAPFSICHLEGSINVPFSSPQLRPDDPNGLSIPGGSENEIGLPGSEPSSTVPIYVICRLGNDSQHVVRRLKLSGWDLDGKRLIMDVRGGLRAWKEGVDHEWPYL
ncbi:MAG: TIM23 complex component [Watsoniomyces obsoletus]|nr:MAG: TIM23 complex component [Watsoniomyces obsoletus]